MQFRLTLVQNLPNRDPSAFQVSYKFTDNTVQTWPVQVVGPDRDTNVVIVDSPVNLINQQNVLTRTLVSHYPTPPLEICTQISSVQLPQTNVVPMAKANLRDTATNYRVNISMSKATVDQLLGAGFYLYGFKAVQATLTGAPLVWFSTQQFATLTTVSWSEQYQAYTSLNQIIPNGQINASNSYPITLGQTLEVTGLTGTGSVVAGGTPRAIDIHNETSTAFTCGISQIQGQTNAATPLCAFPLFGNNLDVIAPIEKVLLMFSTLPVNTGTVIFQAYGPGFLIDLTGVTERDVTYDINQGWGPEVPWAQTVKANDKLVPLLIEGSISLSNAALAARARRGDLAAQY